MAAAAAFAAGLGASGGASYGGGTETRQPVEWGGAGADMASGLAVLSQQVVSDLCANEAGIRPGPSAAQLAKAAAETRSILATLTDAAPESDAGLRSAVAQVAQVAIPMTDYAGEIVRLGPTRLDVAVIQDRSHAMLEQAETLAASLDAGHADRARPLSAHAATVDVAARQRMLAQRMAKDACLIAAGPSDGSLHADLGRSMDGFAEAMAALRFGLAADGIAPPPSEAVEAGLAEIAREWARVEPRLAWLRNGQRLGFDGRVALYDGLNRIADGLAAIVPLYAEAEAVGF